MTMSSKKDIKISWFRNWYTAFHFFLLQFKNVRNAEFDALITQDQIWSYPTKKSFQAAMLLTQMKHNTLLGEQTCTKTSFLFLLLQVIPQWSYSLNQFARNKIFIGSEVFLQDDKSLAFFRWKKNYGLAVLLKVASTNLLAMFLIGIFFWFINV